MDGDPRARVALSGAVVKAFVLAVLLLAGSAGVTLAAPPSQATLEALRQRGLRGETATIEGRIYMEGRKPSDPDEPLVGIGVLLVPHSTALLEQVEALKQRSRESMDGFRDAAPQTRAAVLEYETALWQLGYPDAAVRAVTDAQGRFQATVPGGGAWILFAERSIYVSVHTPRVEAAPSATALDPLARYSTSQYQHFQKVARVSGFDAVSMWLRELEVQTGRTVAVELHDRGLWLSGVVEETDVPQRVRVGGSKKGRR